MKTARRIIAVGASAWLISVAAQAANTPTALPFALPVEWRELPEIADVALAPAAAQGAAKADDDGPTDSVAERNAGADRDRQTDPLPEAMADGDVDVRGFGDPANGCFAVVQRTAVEPGLSMAKLIDGQRQAFAAAAHEVTVTGHRMAFRGDGVAGVMATLLGGGAVAGATPGGQAPAPVPLVSASCFFYEREQERCRAECEEILSSVELWSKSGAVW